MRDLGISMTSTEFNIGLTGAKSSSRVLKPPGGGHTNIFGEAEVRVNNPRAKYDQQNSSNLNFCMNTVDPNLVVDGVKQPKQVAPTPAAQAPQVQQAPPAAVEKPAPSAPVAPVAAAPVQSAPAPAPAPAAPAPAAPVKSAASFESAAPAQQCPSGKNRVPPGGFSSGLW